eukprot:UN04688
MSDKIQQRIDDIHLEISRMQIHKHSEYHYGKLKARLAILHGMKIKAESHGKKQAQGGFDVEKTGQASVGLIGLPSSGKSTLLGTVTSTKSEISAHEFSTLTCIPGVLTYNDTTIQLLDLPGIIEGASGGKGRGREVISVVRSCQMILMVIDASRSLESLGRTNIHTKNPVTCPLEMQRRILTKELYECGIRLNRTVPDIVIKQKKAGGVSLNSMGKELTYLDVNIIRDILQMHKIHNVDVLVRGDYTVDDFIDVVMGNRRYLPALYVVNKIDMLPIERVNFYAHAKHTVVISCNHKFNIEYLLAKMWDYLNFVRVYTKPKGSKPDFTEPVILPRGATVEDLCAYIHKDFVTKFKYAYVWGRSVKFQPQRVGKTHLLSDEDVVALYV